MYFGNYLFTITKHNHHESDTEHVVWTEITGIQNQ